MSPQCGALAVGKLLEGEGGAYLLYLQHLPALQ